MSMAPENYIYCSPFSEVVSLDALLECPGDDGRAFDIPDPQPGVEEKIDNDRLHDVMHRAIGELPSRQRKVIVALYFMGWKVTWTALALQISSPAVIKLREKAFRNLRGILAPQRDILLA